MFNECILVDQANNCNGWFRGIHVHTYWPMCIHIQLIGVLGNASRSYVVALQKCRKKKRGNFLFKVKMISVWCSLHEKGAPSYGLDQLHTLIMVMHVHTCTHICSFWGNHEHTQLHASYTYVHCTCRVSKYYCHNNILTNQIYMYAHIHDCPCPL